MHIGKMNAIWNFALISMDKSIAFTFDKIFSNKKTKTFKVILTDTYQGIVWWLTPDR